MTYRTNERELGEMSILAAFTIYFMGRTVDNVKVIISTTKLSIRYKFDARVTRHLNDSLLK